MKNKDQCIIKATSATLCQSPSLASPSIYVLYTINLRLLHQFFNVLGFVWKSAFLVFDKIILSAKMGDDMSTGYQFIIAIKPLPAVLWWGFFRIFQLFGNSE